MPENFGGNLVIEQAGTTSYQYPDNEGELYTYLRSTMKNGEVSGSVNVNKTKINKSGVWVNATLESVGSLNVAPYMPLKITGYDKNKNDIATFSGLKRTGLSKLAIGIDEELKYWTEDEYGTSTPGSQSFKYYLTQRFQVYDKVTVHDNYSGKVTLTKTDKDTTKTLQGVKFNLYKDGILYKKDLVTDSTGKIVVDNLPVGSYEFKETESLEGYLLLKDPVRFEIKIPNSSPSTIVGGGVNRITPTNGSEVIAKANERFIVGSNGIDKASDDITLLNNAANIDTVIIHYVTNEMKNVTKEVGNLNEAEIFINNLKNNNDLNGTIDIQVMHNTDGLENDANINVSVSVENTLIKKIDIPVTKIWKDNNNYQGDHSDITVHLLRNGKIIESKTLKWADYQKKDYLFKFNKGYYEEDQYGNDYKYTVIEDHVEAAPGTVAGEKGGYITTITGDQSIGFEITNTWTTKDRVKLSGEKIWKDADNTYELRPDFIELTLLQNDFSFASAIASKDNKWKFEFNNIPLQGEDGKVYKYAIEEKTLPEGYIKLEKTIINTAGAGNGQTINFAVTNYLNKEKNAKASLSGQKIWEDYSDVYKKRPLTLEVELLQNNKPTGVKQTISANSDPSKNWTYSFDKLAQYDNDGNEYVYSVREVGIPSRYAATVKGNDIFNTIDHTENEVQLIGQKVWKDYNNAYNTRSESVEIILLQDGVEYRRKTIDGNSKVPWRYNFQSLPKDDIDGRKYVYTVKEAVVPDGYSEVVSSDSKEIINTLDNEINNIITIEIKKIWDDKNNEKNRPDSVGVSILGDDIEVKKIYLKADNQWQARVSQLPKYNDEGKEIKYSLKEDSVSKYELTKNTIEKGNDDNTYLGVLTNSPIGNIKTSDNTHIMPFISAMIIAGGIIFVMKYCYSKE